MCSRERSSSIVGRLALLAALLAQACGGTVNDADVDGGGDADADADTETDGDADADADSDGDADADSDADLDHEVCSSPCTPAGSLRCDGAALQTCQDDGAGCLAWVETRRCDTGGTTCVEEGGSASCRIPEGGLQSVGMWAWGADVRGGETAFIDEMAAHGVSDIFILVKGTSGDVRYDVLDELHRLATERDLAIRVWAWMICFADDTQPGVTPASESYRTYLFGVIDAILAEHAPDGIMLDVIRYRGTANGDTASITTFCQGVSDRVATHNAAHGASILSGAAIMPEFGGANEQYYGQDAAAMAGPLDVIAPMTYRYNYSAGTGWITEMTAACMAEVGSQAEVWPILQNYSGDDDVVALDGPTLAADIEAALAPCPQGFSIFQQSMLTESQWGVLDGYDLGAPVCEG
jgi:hypothetical protein